MTTHLSVVTIVVLIITAAAACFTGWAAWKQARAAVKLTEATQQQIESSRALTEVSRGQLEVARRQVTESLRPILTFSNAAFVGNGRVKNKGSGVALDVWWAYGKFGDLLSERYGLAQSMIPPGDDLKFAFSTVSAEAQWLIIVYESLAGVVSATWVNWNQEGPKIGYHPDVTSWARSLNGQPGARPRPTER